MVNIKPFLVPLGIVSMALFFVLASVFGVIDWSKVLLYSSEIKTNEDWDELYKYNTIKTNEDWDELYKYSKWIGVNVTEEEKHTVFNLACDFIYMNNLTNSTFGTITCFKPSIFNITTTYDCICYY